MNNNNKKIIGATLSSLIFISIYLLILIIITFLQITEEDKAPWPIYIIIITFCIIPTIGIIINLIKRIKEIKGGEEDEASKY